MKHEITNTTTRSRAIIIGYGKINQTQKKQQDSLKYYALNQEITLGGLDKTNHQRNLKGNNCQLHQHHQECLTLTIASLNKWVLP